MTTSYPSKNDASAKNASPRVSARTEADITNLELGSWVLRHHARYFPKKSAPLRLTYIIAKEFYNRETGYAFPSEKTLSKITGLSERQIRKEIKVIRDARDENGEPLWVIHRGYNAGGTNVANRYYPRFRKHILNPPVEVAEEDPTSKLRWDNAAFDPYGPNPYGTDVAESAEEEDSEADAFEDAQDEEVPQEGFANPWDESFPDEVNAQSVSSNSDPHILTDKDREIVSLFEEALDCKSADPVVVALPSEGQVVDVLTPAELREMESGNPAKWFVAGAQDTYVEELAVNWTRKFEKNYHKTFSYSEVQGIYDELTRPGKTQLSDEQADVAMQVLGASGVAPTAKYILFLLFSTTPEKFKPEQVVLRKNMIATNKGREITTRLARANFYENRSQEVPMDSTGFEYKQSF